MNQKTKYSPFLVLLIAVACSSKVKIDWKRVVDESTRTTGERWKVDKTLVSFKGNLIDGDCETFKGLIKNETHTFLVNSQGGLASEGLCIAGEMQKRQFKETIVDGVCFSSCANYLFLASPKKMIRKGLVGFHGNVSALVIQQPEVLKIDPKKIQAQVKTEKKFLARVHVQQELFDITQRPDKGASGGKSYLFLIPSPQTFESFGIKNVNGSQSMELLELLSSKGFNLYYR